MKGFARSFLGFLVSLVVVGSSFGEAPKGVTSSGARSADFNFDGRVDEKDLLDLAERRGAALGESDRFGFRYDLSGDAVINATDFGIFSSYWKGRSATGAARTADQVRAIMGLDRLSGETWRYRCIGGESECLGEERTITGGPILKIDDRQVLPIVWGAGDGDPWAEVLMTLDGPLEIVGLEKLGGPQGLPGLIVGANMGVVGSGPIALSTSEWIYEGSAIVSDGTVEADLSLSGLESTKLLDIVLACYVVMSWALCIAYCQESCDFCENMRNSCFLPGGECLLAPNCSPCSGVRKGGEDTTPVILQGEGVLDYGFGETRGTWEIFSTNGQIMMFNLCWFHGEESKCLTFVLTDDDGPGAPECNCGGMCLYEVADIGGVQEEFATLPRDYCYYGSLPDGDLWDAFRVLPENTETDLYVLIRILEGSGAGVRVYRGSPTPGNIVWTEEFDVHFGDSYYDVPAGQDYWVEIYSTGNAVEYEVRAVTLDP